MTETGRPARRGANGRWPAPVAAWALLAATALQAAPAWGQDTGFVPAAVRDLDVSEHLGETIPLHLVVTDSSGQDRPLSDLFRPGRPVVMMMGYYDCPVACPALMGAMVRCFNDLGYDLGKDFAAVVVSFDPTNTTGQAAEHKAVLLTEYTGKDRASAEAGLVVATADSAVSERLSRALGFSYRYLPDVDEYAHPTAVFVITPEGKIARYFYGFALDGRDMKLALIEASEGRIVRSLGDRLLSFCYHYDPEEGTYSFAAFRVMRAGAAATLVALGLLVAWLWRADRRRRSARRSPVAAVA